MRNIRVLALDQRLTKEEVPEEEGKKALTPIARTATLEVTPQEAELVTLATDLGTLSMVLNSIRDGGEEVEVAGLQTLGGGVGPTGSGWPAQSGGAPDATPLGRGMTLDSDVTSLLQHDWSARNGQSADSALLPAPGQAESAVPIDDRIIRVQIVRGTTTGDVSIDPGASAASVPAEGAVPATPAE